MNSLITPWRKEDLNRKQLMRSLGVLTTMAYAAPTVTNISASRASDVTGKPEDEAAAPLQQQGQSESSAVPVAEPCCEEADCGAIV